MKLDHIAIIGILTIMVGMLVILLSNEEKKWSRIFDFPRHLVYRGQYFSYWGNKGKENDYIARAIRCSKIRASTFVLDGTYNLTDMF